MTAFSNISSIKYRPLPESPPEVMKWVTFVAKRLVRKYYFPKDIIEELISEGLVRYYEVLPRVKANKPESTSYYMYLHVRGRMLDSLNRIIQIQAQDEKNIEKSVQGSVTNEILSPESFFEKPEERLDAKRKVEKIQKMVRSFSPLARALIFEPYLNGKSLEEIGARHGISKSTASRQRKKILRKIKVSLENEHSASPSLPQLSQRVKPVISEKKRNPSVRSRGDISDEALYLLMDELREVHGKLGGIIQGLTKILVVKSHSATQRDNPRIEQR